MDDILLSRLDEQSELRVKIDDTQEDWQFIFAKNMCFGLKRNKGPIYFRADDADPRNGTAEGSYFYRVIDGEKMEQIRVYNGYAGEIRSSESKWDDWKLLHVWREA